MHKKIDHWSIWGKEDLLQDWNVFFREGKKLNKKILQKILKDNSTVLHIFANKKTHVIQKFCKRSHGKTTQFLS